MLLCFVIFFIDWLFTAPFLHSNIKLAEERDGLVESV